MTRLIWIALLALCVGFWWMVGSWAFGETVTVHNDPGGSVSQRIAMIRNIDARGDDVRISGQYCASACTMMLGARQVCTDRGVTFGFHGPSAGTYGLSLPPVVFDAQSSLMASYYPEPLKSWFMLEGRWVVFEQTPIPASRLIKLEIVEECER